MIAGAGEPRPSFHNPDMLLDMLGESLGLAFTSSAVPQWLFDRATLRILAVNDAATVHYGYARDEFLGMTILQLHPAEEQEAARAHVSQAVHPTASLHPRVWSHPTPRGELFVRMASLDVTMQGRAARLVQVVDVTAEVRLQQEYDNAVIRAADARASAEAVGRAKDTLLATVGHELRQPLTPLLPAIAVMERRISHEVGVRAREVIKRQVGVLTRLVDDLLDAARVQQGKVTLERETSDLRRVVEEIVAAHFLEISAHGLLLHTNLPSTAVWVSIDEARFHQILSNLLSNAIRHSDPGSGVWVRVEVTEGVARLVVSDEGHGIDENLLPHLFEPFAQAAPGAKGGLGIGLSVVRTLVELHGGHVTAASGGAGRGAAFVVTLPTSAPPVIPVKTFASDLRSVAELIRMRAASTAEPLDDAIEGLDTALLIADDDSRVLNANPAALALTGYADQDLDALHVFDLLAMNAGHGEEHWRAFATDGRQEGILVLLRKDGAQVPVRYCAIRNIRPGLHLSALDAL